MADNLSVKRGTKIEGDEARAIEPGKYAILIAQPRQDEVEGQYRYSGYTQCPWCGHIGWTYGLDNQVYETIICGACGRPFRA